MQAIIGIESEDHFETRVAKLAKLYGWCGFHIRYSKAATRGIHLLTGRVAADHSCGLGFPDWLFVKPGHAPKYRELKTEAGVLSRHQRYWQALLQSAGADVGVWRPSMWAQIAQELAA